MKNKSVQEKFNIANISIIILVLIIVVFLAYYINLLMPKKIDISSFEKNKNVAQILKIEKEKNIAKIEIEISSEDNSRKFYNYVGGEGIGKYVNYQIIIKNDQKTYKIKTILKEIKENSTIVISGYVFSRKINDNTKILVVKNNENASELMEVQYE